MNSHARKVSAPLQIPSQDNSTIAHFFIILLCALLFLAPLFPDVKLTRPKLLLLECGLYGILFTWLASGFYYARISLRRSLLFAPLLVYGLAEAVFYYLSPDRHVALSELKRSVLSLCAYLVASNIVSSEKDRSTVLWAWFSGSFLAVLYGILQHSGGFWHIDVPKMDRPMSLFGNPIFFAAHIVITLPIAIGFLAYLKQKFQRLLIVIFIAGAFLALWYTGTRAAYIGCGVSLMVFFWLSIKSSRTRIIFLSVFLVFSALFVLFTRSVWLRQQAHFVIWRDTLVMWSHSPWFGTGPGTFHIYFPQFASDELKTIWPQQQFIVNDAHNEYVQYLSETGIAGFGIFLWLIITFFTHAYRLYRKQEEGNAFLCAGLISSAAGILAQNFFSVDMRFIISAVYLFIVMGLVETFSKERIRKEQLAPVARAAGFAAVALSCAFVFPAVLRPYLAQKKVASTPDFFDEKVLEPAKTIGELEALAQRYPTQSLVFEKLGWVYSKEKNWQKAIENYQRAAELDPKLPGPLNNLGNICFLINDRPRAIEYWNRSLSVAPDQLDSRLNLALAYYHQGQLKEASEQLKRVLERDPKNEKAIVMLKQMVE